MKTTTERQTLEKASLETLSTQGILLSASARGTASQHGTDAKTVQTANSHTNVANSRLVGGLVMVDYAVTAKVDSHHTAKRYQCLLIDLRSEPTFHFEIVNGRLVKADLMPTDQFVLDLCYLLCKESPTFCKQLFDLAMSLDVHLESPTPSKTSRRGNELWQF